jgi:cell division protein FtsW
MRFHGHWSGFRQVMVVFNRPSAPGRSSPGCLSRLVLLVLVLIPHLGCEGERRGVDSTCFEFQPSELAKLAVLFYAADYMVRKMEVKERFSRGVAYGGGRRGGYAGPARRCKGVHGDREIAMGILFLGGVPVPS